MWRRLVDLARQRRAFWLSVPAAAHALLLGAAFSLFASVGILVDIPLVGRYSLPVAFAIAGLSGVVAVSWVLTLIRTPKFLPLAVAGYLLIFWLNANLQTQTGSLDLGALVARLKIDAAAVITLVSVGYALFIVFITGEGRRYMRAHTEVALAQEIHRHLVPSVDRNIGRFEFFGASLPSSEVGGDLVDVVDGVGGGAEWVAYVADVSGHGVASGALMGMFKSAVRTRLAVDVRLDALLTDVDRVIAGLRKPGMFVTCAFVAGARDGSGDLRVAVAGHPPILHRRDRSGLVDEVSISQAPIAMLDESPPFRCTTVRVERGDVLALVSDGLMEVFNRRDEDYGLDRLKRSPTMPRNRCATRSTQSSPTSEGTGRNSTIRACCSCGC